MAVLSSTESEACAAVLLPLYRALDAAKPGSRAERVAERALDYAINAFETDPFGASDRPPQFQIHDHLRNAWHNVPRADRREACGFLRHTAAVSSQGRTRILGPVEYCSPEDHALSQDIHDRLREALGSRARVVLDGMLADETVATIAKVSGLRQRSVERFRRDIRAAAAALVLVA